MKEAKFMVAHKQCANCLYTKNKIVSDERRDEVLATCARQGRHFVCHEATIKNRDVCCRGFYDRNPHGTNLMRIAHAIKFVVFVEVESLEDLTKSPKSQKEPL